MPYKTQHMIETDRQLRVNPYVFVEGAEEDAANHGVFVEDAEEDAKTLSLIHISEPTRPY